MVKDATADYSDEMMHAALDINMPNYASAIVSTEQIVAAIAAPDVVRAARWRRSPASSGSHHFARR